MAAQACLTCLATDVRMCDLAQNNLRKSYAALVGYQCGAEEGMPKAVCYMCSRKLNKFKAFRAMSRRAYSILQDLLKQHNEITESNVVCVDRTRNNLGSTLLRCNISHMDIEPVINMTMIDIDINIKKEINCEQSDDFVLNKHENECTDENDEPRREPRVQVKNENKLKCSTNCKVSELKISKATKSNKSLSVKGIPPKKKVGVTRKNVTKRKVKKILIETSKSDVDNMIAGIKQACAELPVKLKRKLSKKESDAKQHTKYTKEYYEKMAVVTVMTREEQLQFFKQSRLKYANMMYICKVCEKGFHNQIIYDKHMEIHDPSTGDLSCWICKYRFKSKDYLLKHCCSHRTKLECKKCDSVYTTHQDFRNHVARKHPDTSYFCDVCETTFDKLKSYTEHVYGKHPESVSCATCGATLFNKATLRKHQARVHQQLDDKAVADVPGSSGASEVPCAQCGVVFCSEEAYSMHRTSYPGHDTEQGLILRECMKCSEFVNALEMPAHRAAHRSKAPKRGQVQPSIHTFSCEQCGKHFDTSRKYHTHFVQSHPDKTATKYLDKEESIMCELCGRLFSSYFMYQIHMDRHHEVKRFKCDLCDKTFRANGNLKLHRIKHTKEKPYKCQQCERSFSQPGNLKRHQYVHTEERPHSCDVCGKFFKSSCDANLHKRHVHEKKGWPKRNRTRSKKTTKYDSEGDS